MTDLETAQTCKALGDENRIKIIQMLTKGELCACRLLEALNITQPTLSHHMKILSECALINTRKEGKWSYYSINGERFGEFGNYIKAISTFCPNAATNSTSPTGKSEVQAATGCCGK